MRRDCWPYTPCAPVSPGAFVGTLAVYRSSGDSERTTPVAPESDGSIALPSRSIATVTYTP